MHGSTHHLTGSCSDVYGDNSLVATVFCPSTNCLHAAQTTVHLQDVECTHLHSHIYNYQPVQSCPWA